jgi:hypothetical protein
MNTSTRNGAFLPPIRLSSHLSVILVFISSVLSCGDPLVQSRAVDRIAPIVLLDRMKLRSVTRQSFSAGDRLGLSAERGVGIDATSTRMADTNVAVVDGAGVLFARAPGTSWLSWQSSDSRDSALVTVGGNQRLDAPVQAYELPAPPRQIDVRYPTSRTRGGPAQKTWRVEKGGDLQAALNAAQPGDEVVLAAGAQFTGNFVLPNKQGASSDWIIVRADAMGVGAGTRMSPTVAETEASIVTPNQNPAVKTGPGAHKWRLVGFQIAHAQGAIYNYGIVVLGNGFESNSAEQPSDIVLDRMYIHGSPTDGTSRCVAFNGRNLAVIDSWLSECHARGQDAQGVAGWGGGGPFLIENNHIEASGEIVLFGGADPRVTNVSPSDITIRRNHLYRPLSWAGQWSVKNIFELKHGKRVLFEGNVLENNWADGQTGFAILFQTLADDNTSWAWTTVQDVTVRNNIIKNTTGGANLLSRVAYNDGRLPTNPTSRILFINNLFENVGHDPRTGAPGRIFQLLGDLQDISLVNNSVTLNGTAAQAVGFDGAPTIRTTIVNNVFPATEYGIFGSGLGSGVAAINAFAPGGIVTGNVLPNANANAYPGGNYFPTLSSIVWASDYSLAARNPFFTGALGLVGIIGQTLGVATAGVE